MQEEDKITSNATRMNRTRITSRVFQNKCERERPQLIHEDKRERKINPRFYEHEKDRTTIFNLIREKEITSTNILN